MPGALIEAAIRSLILALMVWVGLRVFRIQNVACQRRAWIAVLMGSFLMPFVLPFTACWRVPPLASIVAPALLDHYKSVTAPVAAITSLTTVVSGDAVVPAQSMRQGALPSTRTTSRKLGDTRTAPSVQAPARGAASAKKAAAGAQFSLVGVALLTYFVIGSALLVRLLFGLVCALRLWKSSSPVAPDIHAQIGAGLNVRFSQRISTPVTIGSGVVLPANFRSWTDEKLRIVLAHERSHVTLHDFHMQILASAYAALTWFSPLGWWLKFKLSELGEAMSDRSGLNESSSRADYAQVLLEFAAAPRSTLIGVAMARPSSISRRVERLLNDSYLRQAFAGGARTRLAVLVPTILFAASSLVQVQAARQPRSTAQNSRSATATLTATRATTASSPASETRATQGAAGSPVDPSRAASPELALAISPVPPDSPAALANGAAQPEATFDRDLTFNGKLDLSVGTASGNITFTRGAANQIHIHGIVKANENADPAQVQQIVATPPIEQEGNTIRIGAHGENLHNISISYEIVAPSDTTLSAATASGNITDTGVGDGAKMNTASGNITATGVEGGFILQTGSGNIAIEGSGKGDAKAQTGSGNIDLKGVNGALKAQTGSGTIKAAGTPSSPWKLQAGSGNIELSTGNSPMDLDASTGSGSISTQDSTAMQSSHDHHHLHTQLNGGGPEVRAETGSGDIRVQ
jgi:beta-lactamase regulating signal transducer with metallopeptidase domain